MSQNEIINPVDFSQRVESAAKQDGTTVLQALTDIVEIMDIDPDHIKSYITQSLIEKLEVEAIGLRLIDGNETQSIFDVL